MKVWTKSWPVSAATHANRAAAALGGGSSTGGTPKPRTSDFPEIEHDRAEQQRHQQIERRVAPRRRSGRMAASLITHKRGARARPRARSSRSRPRRAADPRRRATAPATPRPQQHARQADARSPVDPPNQAARREQQRRAPAASANRIGRAVKRQRFRRERQHEAPSSMAPRPGEIPI